MLLLIKMLALLAGLFLAGCSMYEHEIEQAGHNWSFLGVLDDSTAAVKVSYWESGEVHDHHLMGYDDDFSRTVAVEHFAVRMNSYWISSDDSRLNKISNSDGTGDIPKWCDGCYVVGEIDGKMYGAKSAFLDSYSNACAIILVDEKKVRDSLEFESCTESRLYSALSLVAHYLKVDTDLYEIRDGMFPTQRPAYRIRSEGGNLKFIDSKGDFIVYGGAP